MILIVTILTHEVESTLKILLLLLINKRRFPFSSRYFYKLSDRSLRNICIKKKIAFKIQNCNKI